MSTYYSYNPRPPRKFRGTPQWTLEQLYISPWTARRRYDEEGIMHYDAIERNLHPTGVEVMDHYLRLLTEGNDNLHAFCEIYALRIEDVDALTYILTGMSGQEFRTAYQMRLSDELLRYTDLTIAQVGWRSGIGSPSNYCVFIRKTYGQTPTERRKLLQKPGDAGRYRL